MSDVDVTVFYNEHRVAAMERALKGTGTRLEDQVKDALEKLYEELLMKSETLSKTDNDLIFVEKDKPLTREEVAEKMAILQNAIDDCDISGEKMKKAFAEVVDTYREAEVVNQEAENAPEMQG